METEEAIEPRHAAAPSQHAPFVIRPPLPGRLVVWLVSAAIWASFVPVLVGVTRGSVRPPTGLDAALLLVTAGCTMLAVVASLRRKIRVTAEAVEVCDRLRRARYRRSEIAGFTLAEASSPVRVVTMHLVDGRSIKLIATIRSVVRNRLVESHHRQLSRWLHPADPSWGPPSGPVTGNSGVPASFARTSFAIRTSAAAWVGLAATCLTIVAAVGGLAWVSRELNEPGLAVVASTALLLPVLLIAVAIRLTVRAEQDQLVVVNSLKARYVTPDSIRSFTVLRFGPWGGIVTATLVDGEVLMLKATRRTISTHVLDEYCQQLTWWLGR